jgi:Acetyltransferase (GNAT) domain
MPPRQPISPTETPGATAERASSHIVEIDFKSDPRWDGFVADHPDGLVYHHSRWLGALEREYGQTALALAYEDADHQLRGVLPLMYTRGLPLGLGGGGAARRLSSLPRTPVAGPLALDTRTTAALLEAALVRVHERPGTRLQVKTQGQINDVPAQLGGAPWRVSYALRLPSDPKDLRFGNSRNHARIKWAVQKAERHGVLVRHAESVNDLRIWYRLYLDVNRWHGLPPRPYRFFEAAWEVLRPAGLMRLLLAEQMVDGKRRVLAGSMFLMFGSTVTYAFNARLREGLSLRPNDALQWRAVHDACAEGFRWYDLGEVGEGNVGLAGFKAKWGAEPRQLYRYQHPPPSDSSSGYGALEANGRVQHALRAVWRRIPLRATEWAGDFLYRYL